MDATHKRELSQLVASQQTELATNTADMRQQLDVRSAEMERLSGEVRECVAGLEEAQRVAAEEAQELRAAISQRDAEIARLKAELTASEERVESSETNNKDVIRRLESMQKQVRYEPLFTQRTEDKLYALYNLAQWVVMYGFYFVIRHLRWTHTWHLDWTRVVYFKSVTSLSLCFVCMIYWICKLWFLFVPFSP